MIRGIWRSSGIAPVVVMVLAAIGIVSAGIVLQAFVFDGKYRGDNGNVLREEGPAQSTYEICLAKCRDQYGGSGSAGFDACVRACGATRGESAEENGDEQQERVTEPLPSPVVQPSPTSSTDSINSPQKGSGQARPLSSPLPTDSAESASPSPPAPTTVNITIQNFAFAPSTITVSAGSTIVFTNKDSAAHTATSDSGAFGTALLAKDQSAPVVFLSPGTFSYHCTPHPWMTGTIVVE